MAAPSPQVLLTDLPARPLLARYDPAPEAPASTYHATHVEYPLTLTYRYAAPYAFVSSLCFLKAKV